MAKYSKLVPNRRNSPATPISSPIHGKEKEMVVNSTGGYTFDIGNWSQLDRFLILGAAGPSYYASQKTLVLDNLSAIESCIKEDGPRVVKRLTEISKSGRAPRNDPALFVLALCAANGDEATKNLAFKVLPEVARTGTFLFTFAGYVNDLRGWGSGLKKAVARWFNEKEAKQVAYQAVKYKQRDGWSMRDVLRLSHPKAPTPSHNTVYHWITKGWDNVGEQPHPDEALKVIWAAERAKVSTSEKEIARLVKDYSLPWEALDTKWLNNHLVWDALMEKVLPEALMRNLGRLTSNGYLQGINANTKKVIEILTDEERIKKARLHPIKLLVALKTYAQGRGDKGSLTWSPVQKIVDALDTAHYASYKYVEPTGKRHLLALDISGSMDMSSISGFPLTPREVVAAMSLVTAKAESESMFIGFSYNVMDLQISPRQRLDDVCKYMQRLPFGSTNIGATFEWAMSRNQAFDAVVIYTDNEVNTSKHPIQLFDQYKKKMKLDTKMVVVGTSVTKFSIADPSRDDNLDCVGFDSGTPEIISNFIGERHAKKDLVNI